MAAHVKPSTLRSNTRVRSTLALTPGTGEESSEGRASFRTAVRIVDDLADEAVTNRDRASEENRVTPVAVS
jgi:hypothetical protein